MVVKNTKELSLKNVVRSQRMLPPLPKKPPLGSTRDGHGSPRKPADRQQNVQAARLRNEVEMPIGLLVSLLAGPQFCPWQSPAGQW